MKKLVLFCAILLSCVFVYAQSDNRNMAFYGSERDSLSDKADTLFQLDSAHITISISGGLAYNSALQNLVPGVGFYNANGGNVVPSYVKTLPDAGLMLAVGFEYMSKEHVSHLFFTTGIEVMYAQCSGNIQSNTTTTYLTNAKKDSSVSGMQNLSYNLYVVTVSIPFSLYYALVEKKKQRLSPGLGLVLGDYVTQLISATGYSASAFTNPLLMGKVSLKYDVTIKNKTGLSFEPYFSAQLLGSPTHIMLAGLKIASL
ncbi:MAG TPA: hypothetical protein VK783_14380 [Bacteroidia bacterium]|jgi:hypothetical protein|nr:hypothetical protein [Bacteroidia bacterium]